MEALKNKAKVAGVRLTKDVKVNGSTKRVSKTADQLRTEIARTTSKKAPAKKAPAKKSTKSAKKTVRGGQSGQVAAPLDVAAEFKALVAASVQEKTVVVELTKQTEMFIENGDGSATPVMMYAPSGSHIVSVFDPHNLTYIAFPLSAGEHAVSDEHTVLVVRDQVKSRTSQGGYEADCVYLFPTEDDRKDNQSGGRKRATKRA